MIAPRRTRPYGAKAEAAWLHRLIKACKTSLLRQTTTGQPLTRKCFASFSVKQSDSRTLWKRLVMLHPAVMVAILKTDHSGSLIGGDCKSTEIPRDARLVLTSVA